MNIESLKEMSKDFKKGKLHLLQPSSKFKFECTLCGKCCLDTSIIVNTYDMIRLRQGLRLSTTEIFQKKYVNLQIGANSRLPILSINFQGKCPFLAPAINGKEAFAKFYGKKVNDVSSEDVEKFRLFTKENPLKARKLFAGLKTNQFVCAIHKDRPLVCRFYPIGRIKECDQKKKIVKETWLLQDKKDDKDFCPGFKSKKEWTLAKWLEEIEFKNYDEGSKAFLEIFDLLIKYKINKLNKNSPVLRMIGNLLYNFDSFNFCSKDIVAVKTIYNPKATQEDFIYIMDKVKKAVRTVCLSIKNLGIDEIEKKIATKQWKP